MSTLRAQPYRISWPLSPDQAEHIDKMFELLFRASRDAVVDITEVDTSITNITNSITNVSNQVQGLGGLLAADGEDGEPGPPGVQGQTGVQGPQGVIGPPGEDGDDSNWAPVISSTQELPLHNTLLHKNGQPTDTLTGQDWFRHMWSTGMTDPPVSTAITLNAVAGTIDIAANDFVTREGTQEDAALTIYRDAGTTGLAITANDVSYVFRNYNSGTPVWQTGTSLGDFNGIDKVIAFAVARNGTRMNYISAQNMNVDFQRKLRRVAVEFDGYSYRGFQRSLLGTSTISGSGLNVLVSAGRYYWFVNPHTHTAFDTTVAGAADANNFIYFYNRTGTWTQITGQKSIDATQYDNAGTLTTMTNNRWRADWVFVVLDDAGAPYLAIVLGNVQYLSQTEAEADPVPSIPPQFDGISVLLGQIVVEKSAASFHVNNAGGAAFVAGSSLTAHFLANTTGVVDVVSAAAPSVDQALVATDATHATWQGIVNSLTGTANQITASAATGDVTLSLTGPHNFTTLAANGVLYGNTTGAIQALAVNATATNKFLQQVSSGAPTWVPLPESITGTANQVVASAATGVVTLSLPQSIATSSNVQFGKLGLGVAPTRFLDILGTTEQLRIAYDASNYEATTVNSAGKVTRAVTGGGFEFQPSTFPFRVLSDNATGTTISSGQSLSGNSLTTGTGLYVDSASLTSGLLVDLQVSGTAAAASQTALNILTAGANATSGITTYGAQISNTHTNATSGTNIALYLNASGATTANYGLIVNAGRVGIGTTTPDAQVEIESTTEQLRLAYDSTKTVSQTVNSAGTLTIAANTSAAGIAYTMSGGGAVNYSTTYAGGWQNFVRNADSGTGSFVEWNLGNDANQRAGIIQFLSSTFTGAANRFLIQNQLAGAMVLGSNGTARLTISSAGAIQFNTGYGAGTITSDASGNLTSVSDGRLKAIQGSLSYGLQEVLQLRPIVYRWRPESGLDTLHDYPGFDAQQVADHMPLAGPQHEPTGYRSLNDRGILGALVNAVRELAQRLTRLEQEA